MIKYCADYFVEKLQQIAETQGKINAKEWVAQNNLVVKL